jgi:hypothetical protein
MADDLDRVLRGLEEAQEFARTYRFEMTDDYRALIARVEAMPCNQPGANKSGRWRAAAPTDRPFSTRSSRHPLGDNSPIVPACGRTGRTQRAVPPHRCLWANLYGPDGQIFTTEDFDLFEQLLKKPGSD